MAGGRVTSSVEQMTRSDYGVWSSWKTIGNLPSEMNIMSLVTVGKYFYAVVDKSYSDPDPFDKFIMPILRSNDAKEWEETDYKLTLKRNGHTIISTDNLCK